MRELVRQHFRFFLAATLAAIVLRVFFVLRFPAVVSDSLVYGDIAKNWLQQGIFGISGIGDVTPTYIRLPGYPAFLALIFTIFGMEHYRAALMVQIFVDIGTCFLIADITRRVVSTRAAKAAFLLVALCPFLASYAAAALTETWEIFFTVLALDLALAGLTNIRPTRLWLECGLAIGAAILLRPDGGLLLAAIELYLLIVLFVRSRQSVELPSSTIIKAGAIVAVAALTPLIPWIVRNLSTFHEFQPLAPRYANQREDFVPRGFNRWVKTWMANYASVEEIYWAVPGSPVDVDNLPARAFDSDDQLDQTQQLFGDYNKVLQVTPDLDARFAALAAQRIHQSRWRYYVWLPTLRVADMWLRPRTETLPCNTRWWEFDEQPKWLAVGIVMGILNLAYIVAALLGLVRGCFVPASGLLLAFVVLRSVFLATLENPEPRYTMECYPVVIVLAAALFQKSRSEILQK
ncbi:MAG TPA: glycosyltransferase family 39 protein [Terriglobales bacterium]|nr:glycosyltransferase family 39 protein [Terriglobales bacterium]